MADATRMRVSGTPSAVRHPEHGGYVVPDPRDTYAADDPLVLDYPWMFAAADEVGAPPTPPESVPIEQATRAPGKQRPTQGNAK